MADWKKEIEKEERLQQQFEEWLKREEAKGQQAMDEGNFAQSRKHLDNAKRYHKMGKNSADRMEQLVPATGAGCLLHLALLPLHLLIRLLFRR